MNLTQQNDEKHIPTYSQGTITPEISPLSKDSTEPGSREKLFKFQDDLTYFSSKSEFIAADDAFGNPLPNNLVSISAP